MRTVLILMKREIVDHMAHFVAAVVLSGLVTFIMVAAGLSLDKRELAGVVAGGSIPTTIVVVIAVCSLGVAQMYTDRTRGVSAFLTVLPATRGQVFLARVLSGVLAILILVIPWAVAGSVLFDLRTQEVPVLYQGLLGDVLRSVFLVCLASYSVGLYAGWNRRSLAPTLAALPVVMLFPLLIVMKGFGLDVAFLLLIFTVACLIATWCRFSALPL